MSQSTNRPVLSVVVPFHDVAEFLPRCLNSLAKQRLKSIEYILVDDGSTDRSAVIAKEKAAADPRFTLIEQENLGLGPARNAGARAARGTYLAFADGDDTLPRTAYSTLVGSLEATGSDLACGNVKRIVSGKLRPSAGHAEAFATTMIGTHIRRHRALLADRTVWNKVFRREFWDRHGFAFPARTYEDSPVTIPAHVLSGATDVLEDVVYHWRIRTGSITQRRTEPGNVLDRLASMRDVSEFLKERAPRLWARHDLQVTEFDLSFLLEALETAEGAEQEALLDSLAETLGVLHPKAVARQPSIRRLELHLAANRMVSELREVRMFRRASLSDSRRGPPRLVQAPLVHGLSGPARPREGDPRLRVRRQGRLRAEGGRGRRADGRLADDRPGLRLHHPSRQLPRHGRRVAPARGRPAAAGGEASQADGRHRRLRPVGDLPRRRRVRGLDRPGRRAARTVDAALLGDQHHGRQEGRAGTSSGHRIPALSRRGSPSADPHRRRAGAAAAGQGPGPRLGRVERRQDRGADPEGPAAGVPEDRPPARRRRARS